MEGNGFAIVSLSRLIISNITVGRRSGVWLHIYANNTLHPILG